MSEDFNVDDLKKKLKKNRTTKKDKKHTHTDDVPSFKTELEVIEALVQEGVIKLQQDEVAKSDDDTLDPSLIEDYRDEEKDAPSIEYESEEDEKKTLKERFKSVKKPQLSLPNLNYKKLIFLIGIALVLITIATYLISSLSDIKEIEIVGNENITDKEILDRSGIDTGQKMYLLQSNKSEDKVKVLPIIQSIDIEREWPNKVIINVKEHNVVGFIESNRNYYPVLENKRVLRGFHMEPVDAPIIHFFEGKEFDALVDSLNDVNPEMLRMISEIYYRPYDESYTRIQVLMNNGQEIIADYTTFGEKINYFNGMRESIGDNEGIIDLEVSNAFIPYNTEEARRVKRDMSSIPRHVPYIDDINESLDVIKKSLEKIETSTD